MKRFVLLGALGLVCAGCGQYAGVREVQPGVAAPAVAQSPVGQVTVPGPSGDIPESPPPGAVSGNAAPTPSHHGTPSGHSRAHSASKGSGYQGSAKAGSQGRRGSRPSPPAGSSQQASHISKITQSYARHNATVLPAGFPFTICPVQGQYTYSD